MIDTKEQAISDMLAEGATEGDIELMFSFE